MTVPLYVISEFFAWTVPFIVRFWFVGVFLEDEGPSDFCAIQVAYDFGVVDSHCIVVYEIVNSDSLGPKARVMFAVLTFLVDIFVILNCKDVVVLTCRGWIFCSLVRAVGGYFPEGGGSVR